MYLNGLALGNVKAVLGQHHQSKIEDEVDYDVECVILHPEYSDASHSYDIALYITSQPMKYTKFVRPVCLPENSEKYDGIEMKVSGWGKLIGNSSDTQGGSATLQSAEVKGIKWDKCKEIYPERLTEEMICAIGSKADNKTVVDSCQGDSGGNSIFC